MVPMWDATEGAENDMVGDVAVGRLVFGGGADHEFAWIEDAKDYCGYEVGVYAYGVEIRDGATLDLAGANMYYVPEGAEVDGIVGTGFMNLGSYSNGEILPICTEETRLRSAFLSYQSVTGDLGMVVGACADSDNTVDIIEGSSGNYVLRLLDGGIDGDNVVSVSKDLVLERLVDIAFEYRFRTAGKLRVLLDGALVDTIYAPDAGAGWDSLVLYEGSYVLGDYGLSPGEHSLTFELSNTGDPELWMDNLSVSSVPEPGALTLLAFGGLLALKRRGRK